MPPSNVRDDNRSIFTVASISCCRRSRHGLVRHSRLLVRPVARFESFYVYRVYFVRRRHRLQLTARRLARFAVVNRFKQH